MIGARWSYRDELRLGRFLPWRTFSRLIAFRAAHLKDQTKALGSLVDTIGTTRKELWIPDGKMLRPKKKSVNEHYQHELTKSWTLDQARK